MESGVLENILSSDDFAKKWFSGFAHPDTCSQIFANNTKKSTPRFYVLNTDKSFGAGEHWCLVFFFPPSNCEFFDPLGFHPGVYGFDVPLLEQASLITFNNVRVQSLVSSTCGHHCIYYSLKRCRNIGPGDIIRTYDPTNFAANDEMVFKFVWANFGPISAKISPT